MRHGHEILGGVEPWLAGVVFLAIVCLIAIAVWIVHRRTVASDGLTPVERKNLPYPQREILSMLRQHGAAMMQSEMADAMPIEPEELAESLKRMEAASLIQRQWQPESSTYIVSTSAQGAPEAHVKGESHGA